MGNVVAFTNIERKALSKVIETEGVNTRIVTKVDSKGKEYDRFFDDYDGSTAPISEGIGWIKATLGAKPLSELGLTEREVKTVEKVFAMFG